MSFLMCEKISKTSKQARHINPPDSENRTMFKKSREWEKLKCLSMNLSCIVEDRNSSLGEFII